MKKFICVLICAICVICGNSQIYMGKTCDISFFSKGIIEDISAKNTSTKPILSTATNEIAVKITIKGFSFEKKMMEEHFNEKYLESDKFPYATFQGKINEKIDYKKDTTYKVTVTGKLNIHNVKKERTIPGTVTIKNGEVTIDSKFPVALKDHSITIPSVVVQNIAEVVEVTIHSVLTEFKK